MKVLKFCAKDTKYKSNSQNGKIFAYHLSAKGLIARVCTEHVTSQRQQKNPI